MIEKKILPEYFKAVYHREKTFELRKDDSDYQVGDMLKLREWDGEKYTGNITFKQIKIHLPVVYYAYEYDVIVGTEPLDPKDPDSLYPYERFENEKSEVLTSCDLVYEYNFTYFTKEDMIH